MDHGPWMMMMKTRRADEPSTKWVKAGGIEFIQGLKGSTPDLAGVNASPIQV